MEEQIFIKYLSLHILKTRDSFSCIIFDNILYCVRLIISDITHTIQYLELNTVVKHNNWMIFKNSRFDMKIMFDGSNLI
jgi:hypothetical protein